MFQGRPKEITKALNGEWLITIATRYDFRDEFDFLSKVNCDIEIVKHREIRSKQANAYFHVLINKIAARIGGSDDDIKRDLVLKYGAIAKDSEGKPVGFMAPYGKGTGTVWKYVKMFDQRDVNGTLFNCYMCYKETHQMDTAEMARLIDGTIDEARELGIQTDTPEQLQKMKEQWAEYEAAHPRKYGDAD